MSETRYRSVERRLWASLGVTPIDHNPRLAGTGGSVRVQEIGAGPVVVFVHGASTCGRSWAELASRPVGFRCLLVDRPGAGLSPPMTSQLTDPRSLADFAGAPLARFPLLMRLASATMLERSAARMDAILGRRRGAASG